MSQLSSLWITAALAMSLAGCPVEVPEAEPVEDPGAPEGEPDAPADGAGEDAPEDGPGDEADCACFGAGEAAAQECEAGGGGDEECAELAGIVADECEARCDGDGPPPAPPGGDDCQVCFQGAEDALNDCLEDEADPEQCFEAFDEIAGACEEICVGEPQPPIGDEVCAECFESAEEDLNDCLEAGGDEDCFVGLDEAFGACEALCGGFEPPPPVGDDCDACFEAIEEGLNECLEHSDDPEACFAQFEGELAGCEAECGGEEPPPPPFGDDCGACFEAIEAGLNECLEHSDDPEACFAQFEGELAGCEAECGGEEPPPPPFGDDCDACFEAIEEGLNECLEHSDDPEACFAQFEGELAGCEAECGGEEPPPPPFGDDCDACFEGANSALNECLEHSDDPQACFNQFEDELVGCEAECGGEEPPPPPVGDDCDACLEGANSALEECLEHSDDPQACFNQFEDETAGCEAVCGGEEPPPPVDEDCFEAAGADFDACLNDADDAAACEDAFFEALQACAEPI